MKIRPIVFWHMTSYSLVPFGGGLLQPSSKYKTYFYPQMEAESSFETSLPTKLQSSHPYYLK
jgi:hypothetical protein